jgi:hypothetical protein
MSTLINVALRNIKKTKTQPANIPTVFHIARDLRADVFAKVHNLALAQVQSFSSIA